MASSLRIVLCLLVAVLSVVSAKERFCGEKLAKAIYKVCKGNIQSMTDKKRSDGGIAILEELDPEDWNFNYRQPLQSRFRRSPGALHGFWFEGSIVDMCCKRSCSIDMLMNFCKIN